jgi:hypothetical protein
VCGGLRRFRGRFRRDQTKARRKIRRKENSSKAFFMSRLPVAKALRVKSRDPQSYSGPGATKSVRRRGEELAGPVGLGLLRRAQHAVPLRFHWCD